MGRREIHQAWPLTARAQQPAMLVIGFLGSRSSGSTIGQVGVINLKAAKALGITFPSTLLATADEVIE